MILDRHIYYVYEHLRVDTGACVYVGKGHNQRATTKGRNKIHDEIEQSVGIEVRIIKDGLTEDQAFALEHETICHYVYDLGYGIDVEGYEGENPEKFLTNKTFGGKGFTDMKRPRHSVRMSGDRNPMYGRNVWDSYSIERSQEIKNKISKASKGVNNPMYNVKPSERMSPKQYSEWLDKTQKRLVAQCGDLNPNAKHVTLTDPATNEQRTFSCYKDCANYLINAGVAKGTVDTVVSSIGQACKKHKKYLGLYFQHK